MILGIIIVVVIGWVGLKVLYKCDKSIFGNSRGISLLSVAGKVLAKAMLQRLINNITELMLPESQCGFRKNRSMCDMIFTARQLQEKCREHQDLFMAFIVLSKASDTLNRELPWRVLTKFGCPAKFVSILCQFHDVMMALVTIGGQESSPFPVRTGVRQGCVLAPVLFNIFLLCVTQLLHKVLEDNSGMAVDFRLDGNLFNIRRQKWSANGVPVPHSPCRLGLELAPSTEPCKLFIFLFMVTLS